MVDGVEFAFIGPEKYGVKPPCLMLRRYDAARDPADRVAAQGVPEIGPFGGVLRRFSQNKPGFYEAGHFR